MPIVLRLSQQKKHPHRYNCFLDNDERITITDDMIIQFHLSSGASLSEEDILRIKKIADSVFTREKAFELLSLREHAAGELISKLLQKGYKKEAIYKVINYLKERNYINDVRFASMYSEELIKRRRYGPIKIREKLFQRGISSNIIKKILSNINTIEQIENCRFHYEKKHRQLQNSDSDKTQQKIIRFLRGKGFTWDIISQVIGKDSS
ncbi:MAG: RecX family transcriptional regulator [Candidatus Marinimicrobia bacterium]|nr:RecX family transcriptional regulator [Candidatus Neomarinimicrobiota bacterium]